MINNNFKIVLVV